MVPRKGQRRLIDAMPGPAQVPDARLVVLGEGPLRPARQRVKQLRLGAVVLPGLPRRCAGVHQGFDLFVLSSETEAGNVAARRHGRWESVHRHACGRHSRGRRRRRDRADRADARSAALAQAIVRLLQDRCASAWAKAARATGSSASKDG
jgi:hypothetical protein